MLFPFTYNRKKRKGSSNATNYPFLIAMSPNLKYRAAIWAQEAYESRWKMNPVNSYKVLTSKSAQRKMEIMGHEVEVQAAVIIYGVDKEAYREQEARAMLHGYDGLFSRYTLDEIVKFMADNERKAERWVRKYIRDIKKQK